jgi:AcrR family transcriptional regulator
VPPLRKDAPTIWAQMGRTSHDHRASLGYQEITRAAVEIADAEGVRALSMRRVAARLGSGTMSLYRHVATKEDLIDLMVDAVLGEEPVPPTTGDWRRDLAELARRSRRLARRHPWAIRFRLARLSHGPNGLAELEHGVACVSGLGLDIDGVVDFMNTVSAFTVGFVQAELAEEEARRDSGLSEPEWRVRMGPHVQRVIDSGLYPAFVRIVVEAEDYPDPDVTFERRLGMVLDGLAASLGPSSRHPRAVRPRRQRATLNV